MTDEDVRRGADGRLIGADCDLDRPLVGRYLTPPEAPTVTVCRRIEIPNCWEMILALGELISRLGFVEVWEQRDGGALPEEMAALGAQMFADYVESVCMDIPIGTVTLFAGDSTPSGWLRCAGQLVPIEDFPDLYIVIGNTFVTGGLPEGFMQLPDFRGRAPIGEGVGSGLSSRQRGERVGAETHQLTAAEMPSHDHPITPTILNPAMRLLTGAQVGTSNYASGTQSAINVTLTGSRGGGQAHNNMQPSLVVNYIIKAL